MAPGHLEGPRVYMHICARIKITTDESGTRVVAVTGSLLLFRALTVPLTPPYSPFLPADCSTVGEHFTRRDYSAEENGD